MVFSFQDYLEELKFVTSFRRPSFGEVVFVTNLLARLNIRSDREVIYKETNGVPDYLFIRPRKLDPVVSRYIFTAHMDETVTESSHAHPFCREEHDRIKSHSLDNAVSVAFLLYVLRHMDIQVLFTTKEEVIRSWSQMEEVSKLYGGGKFITFDTVYGMGGFDLIIPDIDDLGPLDMSLSSYLRYVINEHTIRSHVEMGRTEVGALSTYAGIRGSAVLFDVQQEGEVESVYKQLPLDAFNLVKNLLHET